MNTCLLMAEIEDAQHGETGALFEWLQRASRAPRDPAWVADGVIFDHWEPVSPTTGRLDSFVWMTPKEQLGAPLELRSLRHRQETAPDAPLYPAGPAIAPNAGEIDEDPIKSLANPSASASTG